MKGKRGLASDKCSHQDSSEEKEDRSLDNLSPQPKREPVEPLTAQPRSKHRDALGSQHPPMLMRKQTISEGQGFVEREFFDSKLQMLRDIKTDLEKGGDVKTEYISEIANLLSKQGLPLNYSATGVSKPRMIREFQLAKHRVMKKLLIANLGLIGLKQAVDQSSGTQGLLSPKAI